jgi:hypothetical protein
MNNPLIKEDLFLDLPMPLREPAKTHGRAMVALVYGAGMASEAIKVLHSRNISQRDVACTQALGVLAETFNEASSALCRLNGWEEGELAQCDRDINLSFAAMVKVPGGKIILDS